MVKEKIKVGDVVIDNGSALIYKNIDIIINILPSGSCKIIYESNSNSTNMMTLNCGSFIEKHPDPNNFILKLLGKSKNEEHRTILKKILKNNLEEESK